LHSNFNKKQEVNRLEGKNWRCYTQIFKFKYLGLILQKAEKINEILLHKI